MDVFTRVSITIPIGILMGLMLDFGTPLIPFIHHSIITEAFILLMDLASEDTGQIASKDGIASTITMERITEEETLMSIEQR